MRSSLTPHHARLFHGMVAAIALTLGQASAALAGAAPSSITTNEAGQWGVQDAHGKTLVPFAYDRIVAAHEGHFLVTKRSPNKRSDPVHVGVVDSAGRFVIPMRYAGIDHLEDHRRFKVRIRSKDGRERLGYLDERGQGVVPAIYDELQQVSRVGSEPTNIAVLNGKSGYINIATGKILIPVQYDALKVDHLLVDAQGEGIATAARKGKWGILSTHGAVIVPFEFDHIDDISPQDKGGVAEKAGELVWLGIDNGRFMGTSPVPLAYSSNFVPRPPPSLNPQPFDGLYAAEAYPDMKAVWVDRKKGVLNWMAIPSLQVNGDQAYVSFGLFARAGLRPFLPNRLPVSRQADGFRLLLGEEHVLLSFKQSSDGSLRCLECESARLPVTWRKVETPRPASFAGLGVVIQKASDRDAPIVVTDVQQGGPADKAGLQAGDSIVSVDGVDVAPFTAEQARDVLRGAAGSQVRLKIVRLPQELVVTRAAIQPPR